MFALVDVILLINTVAFIPLMDSGACLSRPRATQHRVGIIHPDPGHCLIFPSRNVILGRGAGVAAACVLDPVLKPLPRYPRFSNEGSKNACDDGKTNTFPREGDLMFYFE